MAVKKWKTCSACGESKMFTAFSRNRSNADGFHHQCRTCKSEANKKYRKTNRVKVLAAQRKANRKAMLSSFGMTLQDEAEMYDEQNGVCAICGKPEEVIQKGTVRSLAVDHNHVTGEVRGLLCGSCNTSIGKLKVDELGTLNLERAIEYIRRSQCHS